MNSLFARLLGAAEPPPQREHDDAAVAAAALLVEAATVDGGLATAERGRVHSLLVDRLGLEDPAARRLLDHALTEAGENADWHGYTRTLKDAYGHDGRVAMVEMLWEVVLADGVVHDFEASLLRRVAALLYVSDRESSAARARAAERQKAAGGPRPWG